MSLGQLQGTAMATAQEMSMAREAQLLECDQNQGKELPTPSHGAEACPAEGQELCDSTSRGNPALSQLLALGGRARCGHGGAAYWQGPGDRPLKTSFNKIDLMRSSAPCGMLITKQPGEKCLGIKGVATLVLLSVLVFW